MTGPPGAAEPEASTTRREIRERIRVLAGAAAVGLSVGAVIGGVGGRVAMRVLVLTSDDRLRGAITDDEAVVNQFTLDGTLSLIAFIAVASAAIAWMYVGARRSLPERPAVRAAIWAALVWSVAGSGVFDPDGFDFTQLEPKWLGVTLFSGIFIAMGALIALGVERAIVGWPSSNATLALPLALLLVVPPIYLGGVVATVGASISERSQLLRVFGAVVMLGLLVGFGAPTLANVVRILV